MMKWTLSGGIKHGYNLLQYRSELYKKYKISYNIIDSLHDAHQGLLWNGGRITSPGPLTVADTVDIVNQINNNGVGFNILFNNTLLQEKDLDDIYCNYLLEKCQNNVNKVVVASDILREYIRKNYPKYKIIASICFTKTDIDFYKEMLDKYDIVVLHPDLNRNLEFISQLDTSRIEVLVNEDCSRNCPYRKQHYDLISQRFLDKNFIMLDDGDRMKSTCLWRFHVKDIKEKHLSLSYSEMDQLRDIGIVHFKLQGRTYDTEMYNKNLNYFLGDYIYSRRIFELRE